MGWIYFVQVPQVIIQATGKTSRPVHVSLGGPFDSGPIKIGYSSTLKSRLLAIARLASQPLTLLGGFDGGLSEERSMHKLFVHLRIGQQGSGTEWFRAEDELTNFIASLPSSDLDAATRHWTPDVPAPAYVDHPGPRLKTFRLDRQISLRGAARQLGTVHPALKDWEEMNQTPTLPFREAIEVWTGGGIKATEWPLSPREHKNLKKAAHVVAATAKRAL